jgi:hypothetical protein
MSVWGYGVEKEEMDKKRKRRRIPKSTPQTESQPCSPPRTPNLSLLKFLPQNVVVVS